MARKKDDSLHKQRRLQILEAAAEIFRVKGFHAARTEEICVIAALSSGTVFRYFRSKEEIIAAIAEEEIKSYHASIKKLATRDGLKWLTHLSPSELPDMFAPTKFALGTDSWLELHRSPQYRDWILKEDAKLRHIWASALKTGQAEGWVRPALDPDGTSNLIMALFSGLMFDAEFNPQLNAKATYAAFADFFKCSVLKNKTFFGGHR